MNQIKGNRCDWLHGAAATCHGPRPGPIDRTRYDEAAFCRIMRQRPIGFGFHDKLTWEVVGGRVPPSSNRPPMRCHIPRRHLARVRPLQPRKGSHRLHCYSAFYTHPGLVRFMRTVCNLKFLEAGLLGRLLLSLAERLMTGGANATYSTCL